MMAFVCVTFTACSSDDDDNGGSAASTLTIGSENISLPYAYYFYDGSSWQIEFYSFDMVNFRNGNIPQTMNALMISISGNEGTEPPVSEFANAHLYVVNGYTMNSEGQHYEGHATVTVSKSGGTYTVAFSNATIGDDSHDLNGISFTYTGAMTAMPKDYQD